MRIVRLIIAAILAGLMAATQAGCLVAAAAVGTGATVAYVRGDLESTLDATPKQASDATVAAAKDLGLSVISNDTDGTGGTIVARTASDTKLTMVLKSDSDRLSKISIRAGVFGDNTLQQRMLNKIKAELAATAMPAAIPSSTTKPAATADAGS